MKCKKCGTENEANARFCYNCGCRIEESGPSDEQKGKQKEYLPGFEVRPVLPEARFTIGLFVVLFLLVSLLVVIFDSWRIEVLVHILQVFFGLAAIKCFLQRKKMEYAVQCPNCHAEIGIPTDELAADCPKCKQRVFIVDGVVRCTNNPQ